MARKNRWDDDELVAFVVAENGRAARGSDWRARLAAYLPEAMLPARFVLLNALPLNSSGKVDRRALQTLAPETSELQTEFAAPRNEIQSSKLAQIWQAVLGKETVGIDMPFLDLGGDSIRAFQVLSRVRDEWQVQLTPQEFFVAPTVVGQAHLIEQIAGTAHRDEPPIRPLPRHVIRCDLPTFPPAVLPVP